MKTSKPSASSKIRKTTAAAKTTKTRKTTAKKPVPSEDEIRMKAQELYNQRVGMGEHGDEIDDWLKAEKILKEPKKK